MKLQYNDKQIEHLTKMFIRIGQEQMSSKILNLLETKLSKVHSITVDVRKLVNSELKELRAAEVISEKECDFIKTVLARIEYIEPDQIES